MPAIHTDAGIRALQKERPTDPASVANYLERAFGGALRDARDAMTGLALMHSPEELAAMAYRLYEEFRPEVPAGVKGWGARGRLDLDQIRELAKTIA